MFCCSAVSLQLSLECIFVPLYKKSNKRESSYCSIMRLEPHCCNYWCALLWYAIKKSSITYGRNKINKKEEIKSGSLKDSGDFRAVTKLVWLLFLRRMLDCAQKSHFSKYLRIQVAACCHSRPEVGPKCAWNSPDISFHPFLSVQRFSSHYEENEIL